MRGALSSFLFPHCHPDGAKVTRDLPLFHCYGWGKKVDSSAIAFGMNEKGAFGMTAEGVFGITKNLNYP